MPNQIVIQIDTADNIHCRHVIGEEEFESLQRDEDALGKVLVYYLKGMGQQILVHREKRDNPGVEVTPPATDPAPDNTTVAPDVIS